jgi:hypothetical protein
VQYAVVTWLKFALLATPIPAVVKAPIVFIEAARLSFAIAAAIEQIPVLSGIVSAPRRTQVRAMLPPPGVFRYPTEYRHG